MTLSYVDETGQRHLVTESFQANVERARQREWQTHVRKMRQQAIDYGVLEPEPESGTPLPVDTPVPEPKPETRFEPGKRI